MSQKLAKLDMLEEVIKKLTVFQERKHRTKEGRKLRICPTDEREEVTSKVSK